MDSDESSDVTDDAPSAYLRLPPSPLHQPSNHVREETKDPSHWEKLNNQI